MVILLWWTCRLGIFYSNWGMYPLNLPGEICSTSSKASSPLSLSSLSSPNFQMFHMPNSSGYFLLALVQKWKIPTMISRIWYSCFSWHATCPGVSSSTYQNTHIQCLTPFASHSDQKDELISIANKCQINSKLVWEWHHQGMRVALLAGSGQWPISLLI